MWGKTSAVVSYTLLGLFAVLPLLAGALYAALYSFGVVGALNQGFTLSHWSQLIAEKEILTSFLYTAGLALSSLAICVFCAIQIALYNQAKFNKGLLSYLVYMPLAFPTVVAAFFFFQLLSGTGFLSRICFQLGIISSLEAFPSLVNDQYSIGIVLAQSFLSLPIFILLYVNLYQNENLAEYIQLSHSLGASPRQANRRVAIPILLKKSASNIILYFIFKLGAYEIPLLLGRSSPETISVIAVRKLQKFDLYDIPQGYALAVFYTFLVLLLLAIVARINKQAYDF